MNAFSPTLADQVGLLPGVDVIDQERKRLQKKHQKKGVAKSLRAHRGVVAKNEADQIVAARGRVSVRRSSKKSRKISAGALEEEEEVVDSGAAVDLTPWQKLMCRVDAFVLSSRFDGIMGLLVAINAVIMAVEYELRGNTAKQAESWFKKIFCFCSVFTVDVMFPHGHEICCTRPLSSEEHLTLCIFIDFEADHLNGSDADLNGSASEP